MNTTVDNGNSNFENLMFPFLEKDEAMFVLSLLKNIDCTHCPCFSMHCEGGYTIAQIANMPIKEYLFKQKRGTESYLCGKLRNIITANEIQQNSISSSFDRTIKEKIGYLNKNFDKCFVNSVSQDLELKQMETSYQQQLQKMIDETQKKIIVMQETINVQQRALKSAEEKIKQQTYEIEKIKMG